MNGLHNRPVVEQGACGAEAARSAKISCSIASERVLCLADDVVGYQNISAFRCRNCCRIVLTMLNANRVAFSRRQHSKEEARQPAQLHMLPFLF